MDDDKQKSPVIQAPGDEGESKSFSDAPLTSDGNPKAVEETKSSGGWGGWGGFSAFSVFSDIQKAAEEISRNAAAVAEKAARSFTDDEIVKDDSEHGAGEKQKEEEQAKGSHMEQEEGDEKTWKSALDKLEEASSDSFLGKGLKVIDHSVENLTSGAWEAFGNAWKGGSNLIQKLEISAANLADTIQHGTIPGAAASVAPSLLETGKQLTTKGMQVLEYVGKETMDLLISETGIALDKDVPSDDPSLDEATFERCFYIYGGPEQLEELEALSNHHALLLNRRRAKLSPEEKSAYDGKLKAIQQILSLTDEEKNEAAVPADNDEMKKLRDSGVAKVDSLTKGFSGALVELNAGDIIQKSASKVEALYSEGVHRLSEMCCCAVTQLLAAGKLLISDAGEGGDDPAEKARAIRMQAVALNGHIDAVVHCFTKGIAEVSSSCVAALEHSGDGSGEAAMASVSAKAKSFADLLLADRKTASDKVKEGLRYLSHVVVSTA